MNSITTNRGNKAKGHPAGTNKEKNLNPCFSNPSIVAPKTIVKLHEKVKIKWDVEAKLYGLFDKLRCLSRWTISLLSKKYFTCSLWGAEKKRGS